MELNFTSMIEKGINSLIKGPRGVQIANLYNKYSNQTNFAIVCIIGLLLYYISNPIFYHGFGWIGSGISLFIAWIWTYVMSVGSLGYMWGFKPKPTKNKDEAMVTIP